MSKSLYPLRRLLCRLPLDQRLLLLRELLLELLHHHAAPAGFG